MKMTHGEIRGTIALGLLLALTLGALALARGCRRGEGAWRDVPEYATPARVCNAIQRQADSVATTSVADTLPSEVTAQRGGSRRKGGKRVGTNSSRKLPPDRLSPLDTPGGY